MNQKTKRSIEVGLVRLLDSLDRLMGRAVNWLWDRIEERIPLE